MKMFDLKSQSFVCWADDAVSNTRRKRIFLVVSGYEHRSSYWSQKVMETFLPPEENQWIVVGFTDRKKDLNRPLNDEFYSGHGFNINEFPSNDSVGISILVSAKLEALLKLSPESGIEVHVDYSSMPRLWYCSLFSTLERELRTKDRLFFWYASGLYDGAEYPTAGVSDISVFSGRPSLQSRARTHIFGLGFDRIRASAIFRVLDPQTLICFYADPGIRPEYVRRVTTDNRDLIAAAKFTFCVPVSDFANAFGHITSISRESYVAGDVVLVPDGPKPLVLASSLVPEFLDRTGIVSLHVRRRKFDQAGPVDVVAAGEIYGFSVAGSTGSQKNDD
jgi:hypothetical protein